jgi:hypothetical protein
VLSHACGAVFDNPDLIALACVGDGEAETGPLATSWHINKFLNPIGDGAVLPVLHLNGYKIPHCQETNQISSARPRGRNTHGQAQSPWPQLARGRQAMTDDIFGGSSPKGNVVWVPTALPALATTLLDPSMVLIPIRKLFTLQRGTCLVFPLSPLQQVNARIFSTTSPPCAPQSSQSTFCRN